MLKTIATGLSWSDRDVTAGRSAKVAPCIHCPGAGARKHGEPNQPSRLPEAAATPTSLLRVRNVSTLRVCQRCASCAARGSRRGLPESCRRPRRLARSRPQEGCQGFGGSMLATRAHMPHVRRSSCHDVWIDPRASFGMHTGHSSEHAAGGRRPVQSKRSWVRSRSDFLLRIFGATRVSLVRT